jgi:hypothetical protein
MSDLSAANAAAERSRAQLRADLADLSAGYVLEIDATAEAERRWAQDPDRDDLAAEARTARTRLDKVRAGFDQHRAAAMGQHTRRLNAAIAEL